MRPELLDYPLHGSLERRPIFDLGGGSPGLHECVHCQDHQYAEISNEGTPWCRCSTRRTRCGARRGSKSRRGHGSRSKRCRPAPGTATPPAARTRGEAVTRAGARLLRVPLPAPGRRRPSSCTERSREGGRGDRAEAPAGPHLPGPHHARGGRLGGHRPPQGEPGDPGHSGGRHHTSDPAQERIREAGFCALVTKPVSPPQMVQAVGICLEAHENGDRWIHDLEELIGAAG